MFKAIMYQKNEIRIKISILIGKNYQLKFI